MRTDRRNFIKQTVSAASVGLMLPKEGDAREPQMCPSLTTDSDIRVLFSGMLLYRFYPRTAAETFTSCDIGPLKLSDSYKHRFSVIVKAREGTGAPYTIWRYFGKPDEQLTLEVYDSKESRKVGVRKYTPTPRPFRRSANNDAKDWRWTLRIEEFLASEAKPDYKPTELMPRLQLTNGLFYTALRTNPGRTYVSSQAYGEKPENLYSVASVVGANICLENGDKAMLTGVMGEAIEMRKRADTKYEIYVEYDPRKPVLATSTTTDTPSHFHKYYDAMKDPKPRKRYNVSYRDVRERDEKYIPQSTPDVPCMGLEG